MKRLRVGIVGLGDFGELHTMVFSQIPYVEITRVCSTTESRAREIAAKYNVPSISTDYEAFALSDDMDVISVVTLGKDHKAAVLPALESGKHVLVEKPIADSIENAEVMVEAARKASGKFMVAHICRFMAPYLRAKEAVDAGQLGDISMIQAYRNCHYSILSPGRHPNPLVSGGIHDVDLALWLTGSDVEDCYGYKRYNQSQEEADSCLAVASLANGTMCSFAASWLGRDAMPTGLDAMLKIIGTKGEIEIRMPPSNYRFIGDDKHVHFNPEASRSPLILKQAALSNEIEYFLGCVLGDRTPEVVSADDAIKALRAAVRLDESCVEIRQ